MFPRFLSGHGKLKRATGEAFEGDFANDEMVLETGVYTFTNGDKYKGQWANGKPEGQGELVYANGDKYTGSFKAGARHGKGTLSVQQDESRCVFVPTFASVFPIILFSIRL